MSGGQDHRAGIDGDSVIRRLNLDRYLPAPEPIPVGHPQHCWVTDAPALPGTRAGLLIEWSLIGDLWYGRVAVALNDGSVSIRSIDAKYLQALRPPA